MVFIEINCNFFICFRKGHLRSKDGKQFHLTPSSDNKPRDPFDRFAKPLKSRDPFDRSIEPHKRLNVPVFDDIETLKKDPVVAKKLEEYYKHLPKGMASRLNLFPPEAVGIFSSHHVVKPKVAKNGIITTNGRSYKIDNFAVEKSKTSRHIKVKHHKRKQRRSRNEKKMSKTTTEANSKYDNTRRDLFIPSSYRNAGLKPSSLKKDMSFKRKIKTYRKERTHTKQTNLKKSSKKRRDRRCITKKACPMTSRPVCGSDGNTYENMCKLRMAACA